MNIPIVTFPILKLQTKKRAHVEPLSQHHIIQRFTHVIGFIVDGQRRKMILLFNQHIDTIRK